MKKVTVLMVVILLGGGLALVQVARAESQLATGAITESVEVGNKICPVSGDKILVAGEKGDMGEGVDFEYKGKIYSLCCPMCIKDFKKDPEKYSAIADKEVVVHKE